MIETRTRLGLWLACAALAGCSMQGRDEDVGVLATPLGACDETVPAVRNVDGVPAYAQCDASANSAIYSNNGIDTSLTSMGADWIKTQYSGGYQCTELAHRYLYFKWQVKWIPNGNAGEWCDTQPPATAGLVQTTTPVHGDLMVLAPGSCGAAQGTGHVALVDIADGSDMLTAVEQNQAGRHPYKVSCAKCFLHVVANDGTNPGSMIGSGSVGSGGMGAAGMGAGGTGGMGAANTGTGGAVAPAMPKPTTPAAGQAGAAAPAQSVPAKPAMPAAMTPVAGTGGAAMNAGSGGATITPAPFSAPPSRESADTGCSVTRPRRDAGGLSAAAAFALALCTLRRRYLRR